jgi:hypothetical protein
MGVQTIIERARENFHKCTGVPFSQMLKAELEDRRIMGEEMPDAAEPPAPVQGKALTDEQWKRIAVKWSVGGDPRAEIDAVLAQRPAPAAKQPSTSAPVHEIVERMPRKLRVGECESIYDVDSDSQIPLIALFPVSMKHSDRLLNALVDSYNNRKTLIAEQARRVEYWRGALARKDQTIAVLRTHLALAKGEAQK